MVIKILKTPMDKRVYDVILFLYVLEMFLNKKLKLKSLHTVNLLFRCKSKIKTFQIKSKQKP